jgi:hypothetical protein
MHAAVDCVDLLPTSCIEHITLFRWGAIGVPFQIIQSMGIDLDISSKLLTPAIINRSRNDILIFIIKV